MKVRWSKLLFQLHAEPKISILKELYCRCLNGAEINVWSITKILRRALRMNPGKLQFLISIFYFLPSESSLVSFIGMIRLRERFQYKLSSSVFCQMISNSEKSLKIVLGCSSICKNLLNFIYLTMKFYNCNHTKLHMYITLKST